MPSVNIAYITHAVMLPMYFVGYFLTFLKQQSSLLFPVINGGTQSDHRCKLTELISSPCNSLSLKLTLKKYMTSSASHLPGGCDTEEIISCIITNIPHL